MENLKTFKPVNGHLEILPVKRESFIIPEYEVHEESGVVVSVAEGVTIARVGQYVFFDSWLAAEFGDKEGNVRWLVPEDAIRAIEEDEQIPTE